MGAYAVAYTVRAVAPEYGRYAQTLDGRGVPIVAAGAERDFFFQRHLRDEICVFH